MNTVRQGAPLRTGAEGARLYAFPWARLTLMALGVGLLALASASIGPVAIPFPAVARMVADRLPFVSLEHNWPPAWEAIVIDLRLPRVAGALLVGASLAVAGGAYQGLFRNPLADPYFIGAAAGAGLGATAVMASGAGAGTLGLVAPVAFGGALGAVALAYLLARTGGTTPVTTLVLSGVVVSSLCGAITTLLMLRASPDVRPVLAWLMGGLAGTRWGQLALALPYSALSLGGLLALARALNLMQLSEEEATLLGLPVERVKLMVVALASLATATAVSLAGLIGFVGLVAPHAVRLLWGHDHRTLLPLSALAGAGLLLGADLLARTLVAPSELPVGVVTAFFGAPFFLYILRRSRRRGDW